METLFLSYHKQNQAVLGKAGNHIDSGTGPRCRSGTNSKLIDEKKPPGRQARWFRWLRVSMQIVKRQLPCYLNAALNQVRQQP